MEDGSRRNIWLAILYSRFSILASIFCGIQLHPRGKIA
jgi:hypothetical protein